jgi:hypothetical protein
MRIGRPIVLLTLAAGLVLVAPLSRADAQRGGGGGGGGRGGRGGDGGGRPSAPQDRSRQFEKTFEEMASLKPVLKDVSVQKAAHDSVKRIEKTYKGRLRDYGKAAGKLADASREAGGRPDMNAFRRLRTDAQGLQDEEYGDVRKLLAEDQRTTFDKNVAERRAADEKREAEQRARMEQAGRP